MYRISIKRNNVKRVSEDPVKVISLPSKWEKWEDVSEPGLHYLKPQKEG